MSSRAKQYLLAAATLAVFAVLAFAVDRLVQPDPALRRFLWMGMLALGVATGGLLLAFFRQRGSAPRKSPNTRVQEELQVAEQGLKRALGDPKAGIGTTPLILLMGPVGSGKTSVVAASQVDLELLVGQAPADPSSQATSPTLGANFWYGDGTMVVEVGGEVLADPERWTDLIAGLRPSRFKAAFTGSQLAPRGVLLCVASDRLLQSDAIQISGLAREIRDRLREAARVTGVRMPVYVVFTKLDQVPGFRPYAHNLEPSEVHGILGATLELNAGSGVGHTEREGARVGAALQGLLARLRLKRGDVLFREDTLGLRGEAFDFPRELARSDGLFAKARNFLVDVSAPFSGEPEITPMLRGFYFVGVRPQTVVGPTSGASASGAPGSESATGVFRVPSPAASSSQPRGRRVAQWVFAPRILKDVILSDGAGRALTSVGQNVHLLRRASLGAVLLIAAVLVAGTTISFLNNQRSANRVAEAFRGVDSVVQGQLTLRNMQRLDSLHREVERLREGHGAISHGWGLNRREALLAEARSVYFHRFEEMVWRDAFLSLFSSLERLPSQPSPETEYARVYADLRSFLVITDYPAYADDEVAGVLAEHLLVGGPEAVAIQNLAQNQFAFYRRELLFGNPLSAAAEGLVGPRAGLVVAKVQSLLGQITGVDPFYASLIRRADGLAEDVVGRTDEVLVVGDTIPGAFTRTGWEEVEDQLANIESLLIQEEWVVGDHTVPSEGLLALSDSLRARYARDYVREWSQYFDRARVAGFVTLDQAATQFIPYASSTSPLRELFDLIAWHSDLDDERMSVPFNAVREFVEEGEENAETQWTRYAAILRSVSGPVDGVRSAEDRARASADALPRLRQARSDLESLLADVQESPVRPAMAELLRRPLENTERVLLGLADRRQVRREEIAVVGGDVCRNWNQLVGLRYPFQPGGEDLDSEDLGTAVGYLKGLGVRLQGLLDGSNPGQWVAATAEGIRLRQEFVDFLNAAIQTGEDILGPEGMGPSFNVGLNSSLRSELTLSLGPRDVPYPPGFNGLYPIGWDLRAGGAVSITADEGAGTVTVVRGGAGPSGLWRLFEGAIWTQQGGRGVARWRVSVAGQTHEVIATVGGDYQVLNVERLRALRCPAILS